MKVLALGYLPKWRGGRQLTGLATGLFDLHNSVNELKTDVEVIIAATDVFKDESLVEATPIIGWNKSLLIKHAVKFFYRLPFFLLKSFWISRETGLSPVVDTFAKLLLLDRAVEKVNPDVIHLHGAVYAFYVKAIWKNKIPVVLRLHGMNGYDESVDDYQKFRVIEKRILDFNYRFVTFVTNDVCEDWKVKYGSFKCPMIAVINGYNSNVFYPPTHPVNKRYDLITISGISERKGQGRVIEALQKLKSDGIELSYLIVGNGDEQYTDKIKNEAKTNKLRVDFLNYCPQNELSVLLWESKWFIQPSASEGFGKTYIESIAAGTPVIIPKHLPIVKEKEILSEVNACMHENESVESIYHCLSSMNFSKNIDYNKVSESIKHLSWNNLAQIYVSIYKRYC